jgi:hypothetical protein
MVLITTVARSFLQLAHVALLSQLSRSAPPGSREIEASVEKAADALDVFYVRRA